MIREVLGLFVFFMLMATIYTYIIAPGVWAPAGKIGNITAEQMHVNGSVLVNSLNIKPQIDDGMAVYPVLLMIGTIGLFANEYRMKGQKRQREQYEQDYPA